MFKKLFNKPKDKNDQQEKPSAREKTGQHSPSNGFEEITERPFDINLDELWEYEFEELHEFIKQYEQFSNYVRNKYNDLLNEFLFVQEKLGLLEKERRRLVTESEQNKIQIENLKRFLDEKSQSPNSVENLTTKSSVQKTEEAIQSPVEIDQSEDEAVQSLRNRAEKLLTELKMAEEPICHNILALMAENVQMSSKGGHYAEHTEEDPEDESEGNPGSRRFDTDNNEALDSARVTGRASKEAFEAGLKEAVSASLSQALKRIGKEVGVIFEGYADAYGKTKQKEKEMVVRIKNEAANKSKNEEYERELKDLKTKLNEARTSLNETKAELESKTKLLEKAKKIAEENFAVMEDEKKQYEEALMEQQKEIDELHGIAEGYKQTIMKDQKTIEELEGERDDLIEKLEQIEKEYSALTRNKDKAEKDTNQELVKYQKNIQTLEEEKKKIEKKLQRNEADKLDIENSLIQEKLKHHQTIADLAKAKEKVEEVQKNLNEETEARKADMRKYEDFKKRMVELEKKDKENKKTIKNLNEQLEAKIKEVQHLEDERNKNSQHGNANAEHDAENREMEHAVHPEILEKAEIIHTQLTKIHQLEEKLEQAMKELHVSQKNGQQLQKDKDELTTQVKILKEKRELGLQEIKRLTKMADQSKPYDPNASLPSVQSRNNIDLGEVKHERSSSYFSPVTIKSPQSVASSRINIESEDIKYLRKIKKGLDEVYKEIIMTITNEKIHESRSDRKATGKFGELVKGPLPSDNFMKIEKQMNDTIVLLQEFMENFE